MVTDEIFNQAVENVRRKYNIGTESIKQSAPTVEINKLSTEEREYDKAGVPSVGDIAASLGISKEELEGRPGPSPHQIEEQTDAQIEAMLPSLEDIKIALGVTGENKKPEPLKAPIKSKDLDENGIPTIEQMKKDFGIII